MTDATLGASCTPNFSATGRRRRLRVAQVGAAVAVALLLVLVVLDAPWFARLLVFVPAALAAISYLQVRRNTCVAHAARGTIEHDDFSTTPAPKDELEISRRVARTIQRDGLLLGVVAGLIAAATALL